MRIALAAVLAAVPVAGAAIAQEKGKETPVNKLIEVGAEAPDFRLNDHQGNAVRLSSFRGKKWVVLAFYPKALTGG